MRSLFQLCKSKINQSKHQNTSASKYTSKKSIFFTGYSLAIATMSRAKYAVMGAPRHKHKGQITVSRIDGSDLKQLDPPKVVTLKFM